jgi:predicted DNA-binding transcriptional regulator YafY
MARGEQLIRQHRILQILEASRFGRTLRELRDELTEQLGLSRLSERTVRRDIEALQAAGMDIDTYTVARGTVWKLGPGLRKLPKITTSLTELLALSLARDLLVPLTGTPYWHGIETLWNKMREALPEPVWKHFERQRKNLLVRGALVKSYADKQGILSRLNRAILQHRVIELEYQAPGRKSATQRQIEPYAVVVYEGSLYVVAAACEAESRDAMRHFKLDRIRRVTALDCRFTPRADFDLHEHFAHSMGIFRAGETVTVTVRCSARVAAQVREQPWHPEQQVSECDNGDVILTIPSAYEDEILPRVLALGTEAEILSPESCRKRMAATLRGLTAKYTGVL